MLGCLLVGIPFARNNSPISFARLVSFPLAPPTDGYYCRTLTRQILPPRNFISHCSKMESSYGEFARLQEVSRTFYPKSFELLPSTISIPCKRIVDTPSLEIQFRVPQSIAWMKIVSTPSNSIQRKEGRRKAPG